MVTLIMFAAHHCTLVTNIDGDEAQKDIIHDITDLFINQLDEELWEELYDNLLIDLDKVVQICSLSYHKNLENALKSIQMDFPDFLSEA